MKRETPLANFPIINTKDIDKAEVEIAQALSRVTILKTQNREDFQVEMNGVNFGAASLVFNKFHSHTVTDAGSLIDSLFFIYSDISPTVFNFRNKRIVVSSEKAIVLTGRGLKQIERYKNSEAIALRTSMTDIVHHLELLTGRHHKGPLTFDAEVDLKSGPGAMLKRMVTYLFNEVNENDQLLGNSALRKSSDQLMLSALLSLPHSLSEKLYEDRNQVAPACVCRAEEYMREKFQEPVSIIDLLRITDCSRSVLFAAFRNARGYSPMEFLTEQRLQAVRRRLLKADGQNSVSAIASECGFTNLGRFAQTYGKRFGEKPSDTLRNNI